MKQRQRINGLWGVLLGMLLLLIPASHAVEPHTYASYDQSQFLDVAWYQDGLIASADLWNGGLDGTTGMGSYRDNFNGYFNVNLDQKWRAMPLNASTSIAQSRAIYMNVEAYRASGETRFLDALNKGVDFLLTEFRDAEMGGFYWEVSKRGIVKTSMKHGYGNVHPIFALAQAYSVTRNPDHLQAALDQLAVFQEHFLDPNFACAIHPGFSRDWTELIGVNNIDVFTHYFEALLVLYDVTDGDTRQTIADEITTCGDFLVDFLYHDQDGFTDRGYVAYNYDEQWQPSQLPYTRDTQWSGARHATTGHNIELAYLLSRAVERGFSARWLETADKLIQFCLAYAIDPTYGGMIYEITDYDGKPLDGNPDNNLFVWWAQAETARDLLHFAVVRDTVAYQEPFKKVEYLFNAQLTDQTYGGLFQNLDITRDLAPVGVDKGNIWKVNYHFSMYFSEVLRLNATYPDKISALNTQ